MYFRRLEIQGFKTFANRTEFAFDAGITAIVGPNGSGKSNVADAIRWVLGEQTIRLLRAKKAEDLIFAGSHGRAPLGMAEVTLTLDNSEGWSSLPYTEITITRRAYRSGENEYLINRQKARLRDITDLLAKANLGQNTYTVIGQGLVDAVLSLKPEERRELLEEAADIRRYYTKLNETQSKLAATEQNIVRANDIAAEIAPRLSSLEKQARLAEQRLLLAQEMETLQHVWCTHLRSKALWRIDETTAKETELKEKLASLENQQETIAKRIAQIRETEAQTRASLAKWREESEPIRFEHARIARETAIDEERVQGYNRQLEDLRQEIRSLMADEAAQVEALAAAREQEATLETERQSIVAALAQVETELEEARRKTADVTASLSVLRSNTLETTASAAEIQHKLAQTRAKREAIEREKRERALALERHRSHAEALERKIQSLQDAITELDTRLKELQSRHREVQARAAASSQRQEQSSNSLETYQRRKHELQTRYELISKWEDSQTGYFPGVRAVLQASRARSNGRPILEGIVGIVGKAIRPDPRAETAIEVTLGSRVQDIIVERWQDAERAIAFLKTSGGGRATFLPLDTIRSAPRQPSPFAGQGILGLASELVYFEKRFQSVVDLLLGRTIVVDDLKVARSFLREGLKDRLSGWQIVTVAGEIVRPSGAVTGGSINQQSGMLGRIRELRELPDEIALVEQDIRREQDALQKERAAHRQLILEQHSLEREQREVEARQRSARDDLSSCQRELARVQSDLQWLEAHKQELTKELDQLANMETAYDEKLQHIAAERAVASESLRIAEAETLALRREEEKLSARLSDLKVSLAVIQQRQAGLADTIARGGNALDALRRQVEAREERVREVESLRLSAEERIAAGRAQLQLLSGKLNELDAMVGPAEQRLELLAAEYNNLLQEDSRLRIVHHEVIGLHQQAALEAQKARDELEALLQRIREEMGEEGLIRQDQILRLAQAGMPIPGFDESHYKRPEDVKRRLDQLKSELRSLASVSPRAIEEYQEALSRYSFLTSQAEDLKRGAETLRQVIAELHKTMKKRFEQTFKAIAEEFQSYFRTLFGGGVAKLTLTDPHDFTQTGIDIVAQPPGKRLQNLALLSGGERALTGVALLFAILKVNPSPVCVLDEVDAALDEANIGRFCSALKGLAKETQFIIITHNRGTMETANALYGVSMAEVGVSKVVSLRLSDIQNGKGNGRSEAAISKEDDPDSAAQLATIS